MAYRGLQAIVFSIVFCAAAQVSAGSVSLPSDISGRLNISSFKERKFAKVVRQQYDYSCGSAAIATLLSYHFDRKTTEREAFDQMFELGDKKRIEREGFSLLEMKLFLESLGFGADGFRVPLDKLVRVGVPGIIMIEIDNYRHFVVVKGLRDGTVLVGDPALGLKKWKRADLEAAMANDIVFVIHNANEIGRQYFNTDGEWAMLPTGPLGTAIDRSALSTFSTLLPTYSEFY